MIIINTKAYTSTYQVSYSEEKKLPNYEKEFVELDQGGGTNDNLSKLILVLWSLKVHISMNFLFRLNAIHLLEMIVQMFMQEMARIFFSFEDVIRRCVCLAQDVKQVFLGRQTKYFLF